jgi:hypothetical protein
MNPLTVLYRRSRTFRLLVFALFVLLWALIAFIAINSFGHYTQFGNDALLFIVVVFAAWAWWYGEDKQRRQELARRDDDGSGKGSA